MSMVPRSLTPGVAVDSGLHYHVPGVPYRPAVVVPFMECPESAEPHSMVQQDDVITLTGVQELPKKRLNIYSDFIEDTSLQLMTTDRLRDEMDIELGRAQLEDFYRKEFGCHQEPSDPVAMYEAIRVCDDATTTQKALDIARRL